jgi:hypothetical protein
MTEAGRPALTRDLWVSAGLAVSATAAAVSSFAGLWSLAVLSGWPETLSPLLPLAIDAYAMTATRVWLAASTGSRRARRFARWNAIAAIVMSVAGNGVFHLIAANLLVVSWGIVLAVGSVPALVLGLVAHLAVLRGQTDPVPAGRMVRTEVEPGTQAVGTGQPVVRPENGSRYATEDELVAAARAADREYQERNGGRPLSRDALRRELRIGGARATAIARRLRQEREAALADDPLDMSNRSM